MNILHLIDAPPTTPWESPAAYVAARRRTLPPQQGLTMALIEVEAGGQLLPHTRPDALLYLVLSGAGTMSQDGEQAALRMGDLVSVPANAVRGIENHDDTLLRLVELRPPDAAAGRRIGWRR